MKALSAMLIMRKVEEWLEVLDAADIWCAPVLTLPDLVAHEGFKALDMTQETTRISNDGKREVRIPTTRSPMRIDGKTIKSDKGAPHVGEDTESIRLEFGL
jgi:crotonobetainyl-CoA:carnitine CoA-transferase CaiB-like acyl-CoA transferase